MWEYGPAQEEDDGEVMQMFGDSELAGCLRGRRSTSGGVASIARVAVKSWSSTQATVDLSSGEAELYAAVKLGCELMGIKSLAIDFGITVDLHMYIDAKATIGMLSRRGAGGMKHVETNNFWLQNVVASKIVNLYKVPTDDNLADILTKYLSAEKMQHLLNLMHITRVCKAEHHRQ